MSFSLAIEDGDLALHGSALRSVSGTKKLEQDLSIWLRERYGSDRFQPNYGSILDAYIGTVISPRAVAEVRAEVVRVLQNYQALQYRRLREDRSKFSPTEILLEVLEVKVSTSYDSVNVAIRIRTSSDYETTLYVGTNL